MQIFRICAISPVRLLKCVLTKSRGIQVCAHKSLDSRENLFLSSRFVGYAVLDVRAREHGGRIHVASGVRERSSHGAQNLTAVPECFLNDYLQ